MKRDVEKEISAFLSIIEEVNPEALYPTGFENAIVGYAERAGDVPVIVLDKEKCIEILMADMPEDDAIEYFEFNILGAYMGEGTPLFMTRV